MANPNHLDILRQGVAVWNKWRRETRHTTLPNLYGANLNKVNLGGIDLSQAVLSRANLWATDLSDSNLNRANLTEAILCEANLTSSYFFQAILNGANLSRATLINAGFREANLNGAILNNVTASKSVLWMANLSEADLSGADLDKANLSGATLTSANLSEVNLTNVQCKSTVFADVDLSSVTGLETVTHWGPSYIDMHTLSRSQGKIPEIFLRGCGVEEDVILYIPSLFGKAIEYYSCFISYSHADKAFARRVHDTLQGRGIRCWLDEHQMNPGDDIYSEIDRGIRYWDKVLLCASKSSLTEKWWVDLEINKAFTKERGLMNERGEKVLALIPLDLDGFLLSDDYTGTKKDEILSRKAADFTGWEKDNAIFEREIEKVIKALRTDGGKEIPPKPML